MSSLIQDDPFYVLTHPMTPLYVLTHPVLPSSMSSPPRMTPLYVLTLEFEKWRQTDIYIHTDPQLYVSKI